MKNLFKTLICLTTLVSASASCFATNIDDFSDSVGDSLMVSSGVGTATITSADEKLESEYFVKDFAEEEKLINKLTEQYMNSEFKNWIKLSPTEYLPGEFVY